MAIAIHLTGISAGLILRSEQGWCSCFVRDSGEHLLGGQPTDYVVPHLLDALRDSQDYPAGEIEGHRVWWVMSLASPHGSIYSAAVNQDRWLFFQNAEAIIVHIIILTPEQIALWKTQLQLALY